MKNFLRSIYKSLVLDYYVLKVLFGFVAIAIIIATVIGCVTYPSVLIIAILTFAAFMLSVLFSIAEKSNFSKLYGTLPIKKREIIIGRYLFAILNVFVLSIIAFVLFCISSLVMKSDIEWFNGAACWAVGFIITNFFISIQFPIYFKFEYSKAMFISILPYILVFAVGIPILSKAMQQNSFSNTVMNIIVYFQSRIYLMILLGIVTGLIFLAFSCFISLILTRKKSI